MGDSSRAAYLNTSLGKTLADWHVISDVVLNFHLYICTP